MIQFRHVSFAYDSNRWIFHDLHRQLDRRGVVWVNGDSGRGKSTLLALIFRQIHPTTGTIRIRTHRILSFHHPFVWFPMWTIGQYLSLFDIQPSKLQRLDLMQLPLNTKVSDLSGGEQGRFYLTILFNQEADVYLLDEPCSGLSSSHRMLVMNWIVEKSQSSLIVVASHLQQWKQTAHLCLSLLPNGLSRWEVLQSAPPKNQPKNVIRRHSHKPLPLYPKRWLFPIGKILSLLGVWTFSVGLFSLIFMQTRDTHSMDVSWMMQIERFESIPLDNSPYVLTQTSFPKEQDIRRLFSLTPFRFIGKDISPLFPTRIEVNAKNYTVVWYEQPFNTPLTLIQGQGPDLLKTLLWNYPFQWVEQTETIQWDISFYIEINAWDHRQGPWEENYLFFSYQAWYDHLRTFLIKDSSTLIDALERMEDSWPWVVSIQYGEYRLLKDVLRLEGYRMMHPLVQAYEQRMILYKTFQQWSFVLVFLFLSVMVVLHWTHHHLHSKETKDLRHQTRRIGVNQSLIFNSIFRFEHTSIFLYILMLSMVYAYVLSTFLYVPFQTLVWFFSWLIWAIYVGFGVLRGIEKKVLYGHSS